MYCSGIYVGAVVKCTVQVFKYLRWCGSEVYCSGIYVGAVVKCTVQVFTLVR